MRYSPGVLMPYLCVINKQSMNPILCDKEMWTFKNVKEIVTFFAVKKNNILIYHTLDLFLN